MHPPAWLPNIFSSTEDNQCNEADAAFGAANQRGFVAYAFSHSILVISQAGLASAI